MFVRFELFPLLVKLFLVFTLGGWRAGVCSEYGKQPCGKYNTDDRVRHCNARDFLDSLIISLSIRK